MSCFEKIILNMQQKLAEEQRERVKHEYILRSIHSQKVLVCFITKKFVKQRGRREECDLAMSLNKLMYAAVKKGTRWNRFKKYPWRQVYFYECKDDIARIMRDVYSDMNFYLKTGGI